MNIKEYIVSRYKANPNLAGYDLSEGSNIYDLVIAPLSSFFEDALGSGEIRLASEMREWSSLSELALSELKNKAKLNHIEPSIKMESSTLITLYFTSPVNWNISAGAKLSYGSIGFSVREDIMITENVLTSGYDSSTGLYVYPGVRVVNEFGDNIPENTLGYLEGAPAELVKISHPAVTNGTMEDDKAILISKLKRKTMSMTGGGVNGIASLINTLYPGVGVAVVAAGDARMKRDIMYNVMPGDAALVMESGYRGKIRGTTTYNRSTAYMLTQSAADLSGGFTADSINEFTQGHYLSIVEDADSVATMSTGNVLHETFTQSSEKIGNSSALTAVIAAPTRTITVATGTLYSPGDMVQIADRTGSLPTQSGVVESVNGDVLTLYNNLSISIDPVTNMHVDIVNAEGLYIGPGWIKSEHEMPIGVVINENEASVVNNELMLGMKFEGDAPNVMKQVFLRYGVRKMIDNLVRHINISSIWDSDHAEEIHTNTTDNAR